MFNLKEEKLWIKVSLILTAVVVFSLSIYAIFRYGNYFFLGDISTMDNNDDVKYIRSALTLIEKGSFVYRNVDQSTVYIMPGLTFTLAFFIKLLGLAKGIIGFRIFQVFLHTMGIFLLFFLIRDTFKSSKIALLACIIDAVYIPSIANIGIILTEEIFKFLLVLLLYITYYAINTKKTKYYIWGGTILGLACLFRPTIALYPSIVLLMWLLYKYRFQDIVKYTLVTLAAIVIVISPWWVRNYMEFNRFIPLTESSGNPFLQGTYINYDQTRDFLYYPEQDDEFELNKIETETAKERLKLYFPENKLEYISWYTFGKTFYSWHSPHYEKPIFHLSFNNAYRIHLVILIFAAFGIISTIRKDRKNLGKIFILLVILYFNCVHLPYFTFPRYVFPVMPLVIAFAAYQMTRAYASINSKFVKNI